MTGWNGRLGGVSDAVEQGDEADEAWSTSELRSLSPVLDRPDAGVEGRRGARMGPVATTNSSGETDLSPRRVGIHFRKLACRSDACGEALVDTWRVRASTPAHDRQAHHVKGHPATPLGSRVVLGGVHGQAAWKQIRAYDWLATEQGDEADEAR